MKINILHISTATSFRGGEQQVSYLIESLQKYPVNQTLICPKNAPLNTKINKDFCKIINTQKPTSISFSLIKLIKKECLNDINIVHAHDSKAHTAAVLSLINNKFDIKLIVTRRVLFSVKGFFSKLKYKTKIVNKIICISNAVQDEMKKIVDETKTKIISSAINIQKFEHIKNISFPFFKDSNIRVAYVAALTFEKDHITFLKSAALILKSNKHVTFYIVGDGKLKSDIGQLIQKMNLQNNVFLTGFIENISSLIPQFDYLLFTSKKEGLGTTILDFYLAKKPVITTLCGGNNEISLHRKTAMVSKVGDYKNLAENFIHIHNNTMLKEQIILNAYNLVIKDYSIKKLGKETFQEYQKILNF